MFMTNAELEVFLLGVVRHVASNLQIADIDFKGRMELMAEIRQRDASLFARLQDFVLPPEPSIEKNSTVQLCNCSAYECHAGFLAASP